jgi:hypothetical protein
MRRSHDDEEEHRQNNLGQTSSRTDPSTGPSKVEAGRAACDGVEDSGADDSTDDPVTRRSAPSG